MSETTTADERERPDAHLQDVPDGAGCTEIWERINENRSQAAD